METGEDRVLLQAENKDTVYSTPILYEDKVLFNQAWRSDWPPGMTPTPIPGRPGPEPPPHYQITGDIFSLDLKTGEKLNLSNTGSASSPAIWGNYLMWIDQPVLTTQQHGSGEVCILNMRTGERKVLTNDATYMHMYSSPQAGDGFFIWADSHRLPTAVRAHFPGSDEMVYLQGPEGKPRVATARAEGKVLFWQWADWSGVSSPTITEEESERVKSQPWKVFMTVFE